MCIENCAFNVLSLILKATLACFEFCGWKSQRIALICVTSQNQSLKLRKGLTWHEFYLPPGCRSCICKWRSSWCRRSTNGCPISNRRSWSKRSFLLPSNLSTLISNVQGSEGCSSHFGEKMSQVRDENYDRQNCFTQQQWTFYFENRAHQLGSSSRAC